MEIVTINPLSTASAFIELMFEAEILAIGTAFYFQKDDRLFLVSNWHNFSGRDPITRKPVTRDLAVPDRVRVHAHTSQPSGDVEVDIVTYALSADGVNLWYEHPEFGSLVDVGALLVSEERSALRYDVQSAINDVDPHEKWPIQVGEDLFILGFPFGISPGPKFPVWKSASIASEPQIDIDGKPLLYVDTASRPGMSGSPVVQHSRRSVSLSTSKPNSPVYRFRAAFIGVYSGRVVAKDPLDAQLGMVWKARCIEEIITGLKVAET